MHSAVARSCRQECRKLHRRLWGWVVLPRHFRRCRRLWCTQAAVDDDMVSPSNVGRKLTRSQVGWLDLLFRGMVSIPVDGTLEEACRLIS